MIFIGRNKGEWKIFRPKTTPTFKSHGHLYTCSVGPFRTIRGARYMVRYGENNPHCRCVQEAEKLAKMCPDLVKA